jgi:hypothetical protein
VLSFARRRHEAIPVIEQEEDLRGVLRFPFARQGPWPPSSAVIIRRVALGWRPFPNVVHQRPMAVCGTLAVS